MQNGTRIIFCIVLSVMLSVQAALVLVTSAAADPVPKRSTFFISDLHWGLGQIGKDWDSMEDFRWPNAFEGFLKAISKRGNNSVDLVIVGDLLDLWQAPDAVKCKGHGENRGCNVDEMKTIASAVLTAHKTDLASLRNFLKKDWSNHLYVLPGNHDSTFLLPDIWNMFMEKLGAPSGRVTFMASGIWISSDGRIVAEHGHQIGSDVNRYETWPRITEKVDGKEYIIRPWGELFVQKIYNEKEQTYNIIDNLIPETAGLRYYMADRGFDQSAADVARFIAFNLFETSFQQKLAALGGPSTPVGAKVKWNRKKVLKLGYQLFTKSMPPDDPFRKKIEENTAEASAVREQLNDLAKTLPDEDLKKLCANMIVISKNKEDPCGATLGSVMQKMIPREEIIRGHLLLRKKDLSKELANMAIFIYGHTHELETPWTCKLYDAKNTQVIVVNSGAFQRLLDEEGYLKRVKQLEIMPKEGLLNIKLEMLPPCYTFVSIDYTKGRPVATVKTWHMDEEGKGEGFVTPGVSICK